MWHWWLIRPRLSRTGRNTTLRASRKRIAVDEGMPGCSTLDLAEADKIATLEVPIAVLELPEGRVRLCGVEDVAHYQIVRYDANCFFLLVYVPL